MMSVRTTLRWLAVSLLAGSVTFGAFGCAQDVGDIDRTQPDKVEKEHFEDGASWYYIQTVVDTTVSGNTGIGIDSEFRPYRAQKPLWTGAVSRKLKRIQWEVHEDVLYARSTVEPARGVTEQVDGKQHQELGIVAAFPIKSHFDVQRQYNSNTGEPTNVIVENRTDRPWHEREYMRVDWSNNLVTATSSVFNGQTWGLMSPKAGTKSSRSIPQDEDRIDPGRTEISKNIVSATSEYVFDPDVVGCIAAMGADSAWRCDGGTATVRNFFWRVDARKKRRYGSADGKFYKPMQYRDDEVLTKKNSNEPIKSTSAVLGGEFLDAKCTSTVNQQNRQTFASEPEERCNEESFNLFGRFGYFRTNVATWSEERHAYDSGRIQYANRWNIWETMYDNSNDGSQKIDMSQREPEPIVYHLNAGYPQEMMEIAEVIEDEWATTFAETVAHTREDTAASDVESQLEEEGWEDGHMFIIKKNSCHPSRLAKWQSATKVADDRMAPSAVFEKYVDSPGQNLQQKLWDLPVHDRKRLCEKLEWATEPRNSAPQNEVVYSDEQRIENDRPFVWQQRGDLRYSLFSWVRELNTQWLGYGPSSADPKTGEIISAAANFAGRLLPLIANQGADIVKYSNGDYSRERIERGLQVRDQLARGGSSEGTNTSGDDQSSQELNPPAMEDGLPRKPVDDEVPESEQPTISLKQYRDRVETEPIDEQSGKTPKEFGRKPEFINEAAYRDIKASEGTDAFDSRVNKWLQRPEVKKDLMSNPMMEQAVKTMSAETAGKEGPNQADRNHQSYMALNSPMTWERQIEQRRRLLRRSNIYSTHAGKKAARQLALTAGASKRFEGESHETIAEYFKKRVFFGTQLHEVGHTLGLRHNYSASLDATNYPDPFWEFERLQQTDCDGLDTGACSDGELTEREARVGGPELTNAVFDDSDRDGSGEPKHASKAEHRLASIMDYTAPPRLSGRNAGLGKYDKAAINFAYGRQLQRFDTSIPGFPKDFGLDLRIADYFQVASLLGDEGSYSAPREACRDADGNVEAECLKRGIRRLTEAREWISIEEAKDYRRDILKTNTQAFEDVYEKNKPARNVETIGSRIVPYRFCTDDRDGRFLGCQSFDWGSNQLEVVSYAIQEFKFMQPFDRYRGSAIEGRSGLVRLGGLQSNYARNLLSTLSLIDTPFRYFSFYNAIDLNLGATTADVRNAAKVGLNFYGDLLTQPSPERYCYYDESDNVDPRFNINEKAATPNGLFVPDNVYYRDRALDQCQKEIARIHAAESGQRYEVELFARKSDQNNGASLFVEYTAGSDDTRADIAAELQSKLETAANNDSDFSSFTIRRVKADIVAETFETFEEYGLRRGPRNEASEQSVSTMSSPHTIDEGTGEFFGFKTSSDYHYRVNRVGTYIDKLLAASRMFQLNANFSFAEFATDLRSVNISYWTEFPDELYRMLHGLFLGNYSDFGGGYSPSEGEYKTWNLLGFEQDDDGDGATDQPRGADLIGGTSPGMPTDTWPFQTPNSFTTRRRLLVFAIAEFSTWQDKVTDFDEYTVIAATEQERQNLPEKFTEVKNGETVLSQEGKKRTIEFVHPITNRSYVAVAANAGPESDAPNQSISYDLLEWAKRVKTKYENASDTPGQDEELSPKEKYRRDLENIVARINLIRRIRAFLFREG